MSMSVLVIYVETDRGVGTPGGQMSYILAGTVSGRCPTDRKRKTIWFIVRREQGCMRLNV